MNPAPIHPHQGFVFDPVEQKKYSGCHPSADGDPEKKGEDKLPRLVTPMFQRARASRHLRFSSPRAG
jgi:hypothetical protein